MRYARWLNALGAGEATAPAGIALEATGQAWMAGAAIGGVQPGGALLDAFRGNGGRMASLAGGVGGALVVGGMAGGSWGPIQGFRAFQPNPGKWAGQLTGFVARYTPNPQGDCSQAYAVNGASYRGPEAASSSIVALFGCGFTDTAEAASSARLPETLAGVRVLLAREYSEPIAAALYAVTPNQVNFVVPAGLPPGSYKVVVRRGMP